ncbi:MAG: hypothetical protein AB7S78_04105 [Candidatus Omnitrophota bacterium]
MTNNTRVLCILVFYLAGCSWIKTPSWLPFTQQKNQEISQKEDAVIVPKTAIPIDEGRMISPQKLQEGGKLLLVPFRAGGNVVATKELDKIAFRMMQGISIALEDNKPDFEILINLDQSQPDFLIDGYFTVKKESSDFLAKWFFRKKKYVLGVEGKLMDANSREVIAIFSDTMASNSPQEDFVYLGFRIGQNIGDFIRISLNPQ